MTSIVSIKHLCSCLSHVLYSADLMAMGSCCLILTGSLSQFFVMGENQPLAEITDPYLCSWGPSTHVKGRKLCFLRILSMACSVAKSCDAGRTPPSAPSPAQERARALFTLSEFQNRTSLVTSKRSSSRVSVQIKGWLTVGTPHEEKPRRKTPLCCAGWDFLAWSLIPLIRGGSHYREELWPLFLTLYSLAHLHSHHNPQRQEEGQALHT